MNIIIYTVVILTIFYFLLKFISNISSKKISKTLRFFLIIGLIILAILFAIGGRFLLTLPLTLAGLALLKLKGLSIFQLISLYRLIQTLRRSERKQSAAELPRHGLGIFPQRFARINEG